MGKIQNIEGHKVEFNKSADKAIIQIQLDQAIDCYLIDIFSVDEIDYIALLPTDDNELFIFKYEDLGDENVNLKVIDEDELLDTIYHIFGHGRSDEAIDEKLAEYVDEDEEMNLDE